MEFKKQRVVVKVGTSTITHPSGAPNLRNIEILARTLSDLQDMGHEMILVSSGAIAVGTDKLGLAERPRELRFKQAAASVGQCRLMFTYDKFFSEYGHTVGQILLTDERSDPILITNRIDYLVIVVEAWKLWKTPKKSRSLGVCASAGDCG